MAYADDLETARDNIAARLADITADPKPSYSIDGQSIDWNGYFNSLTNQLKVLNEQLQGAEGSVLVRSRGFS